MKNLSERIGYFDTIATEQAIKDYEEKFGKDNIYYIKLKELVEKQKAGDIITDAEYQALPCSGIANYWSAAHNYYIVNFNYSFFNSDFNGSVSLLYKFMDFLANVNFALCRESEICNWRADFKQWFLRFKEIRPDLQKQGEFVLQILEAVDPLKHNKIGSLLNIDRTIAPDIFDNAVLYFKIKATVYNVIEQQYADVKSLKAKDVMEILEISRRTLSRYVSDGKIIIDSNINGKYRYNKDSVFKLLRHDEIN